MAVTTWEDLRFTDVNDAFLAKTGLRIRCISGMIVSPVYVWQGKSWSFGRPGRSPLV